MTGWGHNRMSVLRILYAPVRNLVRGMPLLAVFQVCLRCNSNCGYCNLPLNQGRYEMTRMRSGGSSPNSTGKGFAWSFSRVGSRCSVATYRRLLRILPD